MVIISLRRHQPSAVSHNLTHSVKLVFGPKPGFKNICGAPAGFGIQNEASL